MIGTRCDAIDYKRAIGHLDLLLDPTINLYAHV